MAEATAHLFTTLKGIIELCESGQISSEALVQGLKSAGISVKELEALSGVLSKIANAETGAICEESAHGSAPHRQSLDVETRKHVLCPHNASQGGNVDVEACEQATTRFHNAVQGENTDVEAPKQAANRFHNAVQGEGENMNVEAPKRAAVRIHSALEIKNITVDKSLLQELQTWPLSTSQNQPDLAAPDPPKEYLSSLVGIYVSLCRSDKGRAIIDVKRRFTSMALFRSVRAAKYHSGHKWGPGAKEALISIISKHKDSALVDTATHTSDIFMDIGTKLTKYFEFGKSFDEWSKELGGDGYLLLIPTEIPETTLGDRHARPKIKLVTGHFRTLNIEQLANDYNVLEVGKEISQKLELTLPEWSRKRKRNLPAEGEDIADSPSSTSRGANFHTIFNCRHPVSRPDSSQAGSNDVLPPLPSQAGPDNSAPSLPSRPDLNGMARPLPLQTDPYGLTPFQADPSSMVPPSLSTTDLYGTTPFHVNLNNMAPPPALQIGSSGLGGSLLPQENENMLDFNVNLRNDYPPYPDTNNCMDGHSAFVEDVDWDLLMGLQR